MPRINSERYLNRNEDSERRRNLDVQLSRVATSWAKAWSAPEHRLLDSNHRGDATKEQAAEYQRLQQARANLDL